MTYIQYCSSHHWNSGFFYDNICLYNTHCNLLQRKGHPLEPEEKHNHQLWNIRLYSILVFCKYPRLGLVTGSDTNGNYSKFSDIFLEDGDYLRLKNITLGYTLPKSVSRFVGMENGSLRVYISVDNVCTITGYSGVDPEVGNYGIDRGVYPVSRFFNFGVNINF